MATASKRFATPRWRQALRFPSCLATCALLGCLSTRAPTVDAGSDAGDLDAGDLDAGSDGGFDAGPDAGPEFTLALTLHRGLDGEGAGGDLILAFVTAADTAGLAVSGLAVSVDAGGVVVAATEDAGSYLAAITSPFTSGELILTATVAGSAAFAQATALVLPQIGAAWDQPQPVAGLVNTAGTEDSSTVSPDGEWLIVGTYSPMDILCCGTDCGQGFPMLDGNNPACINALGPVSGPARPGMPGAERVTAGRLSNPSDPQMCAVLPDGGPIPIADDGGTYPLALPLVAAYGFHLQADGSYAEPFLIDIGTDGFVGAPFCVTFLGSGDAGDLVPAVFGYNLDSSDGGKPHPWFTHLVLGETNLLGSYACNAATLPGFPTFTPGPIAAIPVGPPGQQAGNTSVAFVVIDAGDAGDAGGATYLLSDDESANPPYVEFSQVVDGGYTDWQPMALPEPGIDRRQPVLADGRLFYYRGAAIASVTWDGTDPSDAGVFGGFEIELATDATPSARTGEVVGLGQPTFAVIDGGVRMFFVYYRRSATGADGQIGSVLLR